MPLCPALLQRKNIHSTRSVHPSTVQRHALKPRHAVQMSGDDGAGGVPADFRRKAADAVAGGPVVNSADVYVPNIPKSTATMTMLANSVRGACPPRPRRPALLPRAYC